MNIQNSYMRFEMNYADLDSIPLMLDSAVLGNDSIIERTDSLPLSNNPIISDTISDPNKGNSIKPSAVLGNDPIIERTDSSTPSNNPIISDPIGDPNEGNSINPIEKYLSERLLKKSLIKYIIPDTMKIGQTSRIVISLKLGTDTLINEAIQESFQIQGLSKEKEIERNRIQERVTTIDTLFVSNYAEVDILDPKRNFDISPLFTQKLKLIDSLKYTSWEWGCQPLEKGNFSLIVNVSTKIYDGNNYVLDEFKVFEKEILVYSNPQITILDFFNKYWQWLISTFLIPIFIWQRKIFIRRGNDKPIRAIGYFPPKNKKGK